MKVTINVTKDQQRAIRAYLTTRLSGGIIRRDDIDTCGEVLAAVLAQTPSKKAGHANRA
jgi:hypothetical protein